MKKLSNKLQRTIRLLSFTILLLLACIGCKDGGSSPYDDVGPGDENSTIEIPPLTGNVPLAVKFPANFNGSGANARPFFDIFSWEMFVALSWPLDGENRGVPKNPTDENTFLDMTNTTPVVWASYKNQFDLFGQEDKRPSAWNSWDNPVNPCDSIGKVKHVFGTAKGRTLDGNEIDEAFSFPLVDQEKNYALFEMRYNKEQYNFVRGQDDDPTSWLYLRKNLVNKWIETKDSIVMPESSAPDTYGALMVKAAWKELTDNDIAENYYVINEVVYDSYGGCSTKKMGLVGIHLVQKLKGFEQWIWSSFEHRNNIPGQGSQEPYTFNNGTDTPATTGGWANRPDGTAAVDKNDRVPTQVTRFNEIPTTPKDSSTVDINKIYQEKLKNTVWKNYQLVITQWPQNSAEFIIYGNPGGIYPEASGAPFPINGCTNTAAETYFQSPNDATGKGGNSCMSCHYQTSQSDFSWSLTLRAH